ncbi:MAG: hypothetical protein M0Z40_01110 [Actinomycetota bacterium]|nr:hypothetical protein [Actinomycetota bacterium]
MTSGVIQWLDGRRFDDLTMMIRLGITWTAIAPAVPLTIHICAADRPTMPFPMAATCPLPVADL